MSVPEPKSRFSNATLLRLKRVGLQVAYGFSEWLWAYRVLAGQKVPKPPLFEAFKVSLSRTIAVT